MPTQFSKFGVFVQIMLRPNSAKRERETPDAFYLKIGVGEIKHHLYRFGVKGRIYTRGPKGRVYGWMGGMGWTKYQKCPSMLFVLCGYIEHVSIYLIYISKICHQHSYGFQNLISSCGCGSTIFEINLCTWVFKYLVPNWWSPGVLKNHLFFWKSKTALLPFKIRTRTWC